MPAAIVSRQKGDNSVDSLAIVNDSDQAWLGPRLLYGTIWRADDDAIHFVGRRHRLRQHPTACDYASHNHQTQVEMDRCARRLTASHPSDSGVAPVARCVGFPPS